MIACNYCANLSFKMFLCNELVLVLIAFSNVLCFTLLINLPWFCIICVVFLYSVIATATFSHSIVLLQLTIVVDFLLKEDRGIRRH